MTVFPRFGLPAHLHHRPYDLLVLGAGKHEMILRVSDWPQPGGQTNVDIMQSHNEAGGSGMNVATIMARLGGKSALVAALGAGRNGQTVWDEMTRSGVDTQFVRRIEGSEGSLLIILTRADGDWIVMQENDPRVQLAADQLPTVAEMAQFKLVHIDGFSYMEGEQRSVIELGIAKAREAGCIVSIDTAVPSVQQDPSYVHQLFRRCDIVFANAFEAEQVTGCSESEALVAAMRDLQVSLVVLKLGADGSWLITREEVGKMPAFPVQIVDTIAAGDSYAAAFLLGLCRGETMERAAEWGSAAGAMACLGTGSLSHRFDMQQLHKFVSENGPRTSAD